MNPRVVRHSGYDLHCSARLVDNGQFVPVLMVAKAVWPSRPRNIAVEPGVFPTEEAAADAAQAKGIEWVAHYG